MIIKGINDLASYSLSWSDINEKEWNDYISESGMSNYLQSWEYGNAKKKVEHWRIKRVVIKENDEVIAFFQMLVKHIGPISLCRINRGPIFIKNLSLKNKFYVLHLIRNTFNWIKGKIVMITPEIYDDPENIAILRLLNYKKKGNSKWNSTVLDISESEEYLRKNLNGKWRNQLKKSESYNTNINIGNSASLFNWLMNEYISLQKNKSFKGPKVDLYESIFQQNPGKLVIFQATADGIPVAGQMYIKHGKTSTYLVGCNSDQGRKIYAHNYLIWNAILHLKQKKINWFDLGGIDDSNTPGITKFKRGVNGLEYKLVGDWVN